jgi:hypothetical protein
VPSFPKNAFLDPSFHITYQPCPIDILSHSNRVLRDPSNRIRFLFSKIPATTPTPADRRDRKPPIATTPVFALAMPERDGKTERAIQFSLTSILTDSDETEMERDFWAARNASAGRPDSVDFERGTVLTASSGRRADSWI